MSGGKPKPVLLAIHGVGNPARGDVLKALHRGLEEKYEQEVKAVEYYWNEGIDNPNDGDWKRRGIDFRYTVELVSLMGESAALGLDRYAAEAVRGFVVALYRFVAVAGYVCLILPTCAAIGRFVELILQAIGAGLRLVEPPASSAWRWWYVDNVGMVWVRTFRWLACTLYSIGLIAALVLFLFGILLVPLKRQLSPLVVITRAAVLCVLGPPVAMLVLPFTVPWGRIGAFFLKRLRYQFLSLLAMSVYFGYRWWRGSDGLQPAESFAAGFFINVGYALFAFVMVVVTGAAIAPTLKILFDIFRYLADPPYREQLQNRLSREVAALHQEGNSSHYYVVAHSLGSVIAIDALVNREVWGRDHHIVLITMGSPIRRFFLRFFPGELFADRIGIAKLSADAGSRVGSFLWINVYRPLDVIGAALGLSRARCGIDQSTAQLLENHTGYFSDPKVRDNVLKCLREAKVLSAH
jgi:hypothetical protein